MDPELLALLFGPNAQPMMPPPTPQAAPVVPVPTPTTVQAAMPQGGMPPAQSFEPTNPGNPMQMRPPEPYMSEPMGVGATPLGAALDPSPTGQVNPWSKEGTLGSGPASAAGATQAGSDALLKTLRGVQMPAAPTPQKVSTPHAPNPVKMQGGQLMDLLASLGIGPQQALPGLKLPSTLGQALGGR